MPGLIALVIAVIVFLLLLKTMFLVFSIVIALGVAIVVYWAAERMLARRR